LVSWASWFFIAEWSLMFVMVYLATRNISKESKID
jgi:predicted secreted protein